MKLGEMFDRKKIGIGTQLTDPNGADWLIASGPFGMFLVRRDGRGATGCFVVADSSNLTCDVIAAVVGFNWQSWTVDGVKLSTVFAPRPKIGVGSFIRGWCTNHPYMITRGTDGRVLAVDLTDGLAASNGAKVTDPNNLTRDDLSQIVENWQSWGYATRDEVLAA